MSSNQELSKEDIQKMSTQFQQLQYQADALSQQLNMVSASLAESEKAINTITGFEGVEDGQEILIPIGSGTNIMAKLLKPDTVIMEIGAGISMEKDLDNAKKSLEIQKEELTKFHQTTQNNLEQIATKMGVIRQFLSDVFWGDLDYLIIDLPPGTGDEPLSVAQLIPHIDGAIVVTTPQDVALLDSRKAVNFAKELSTPVIGIIENMSGFKCPKCGETIDLFKIGGGERAAKDMSVPFLGRVPIDVKIVESGDSGIPFMLKHKSEATEAFETIVDNIEHFVKGD